MHVYFYRLSTEVEWCCMLLLTVLQLYCAQWLGEDYILCGGTANNLVRTINRYTLEVLTFSVHRDSVVYIVCVLSSLLMAISMMILAERLLLNLSWFVVWRLSDCDVSVLPSRHSQIDDRQLHDKTIGSCGTEKDSELFQLTDDKFDGEIRRRGFSRLGTQTRAQISFAALSRKRCTIEFTVTIINRKSYMGFWFVKRSVILNDLKRSKRICSHQ